MSLGEPLFATASLVTNWILLEQPGPWGYEALERSRLPTPVARDLRRRSRALGIRIVLIRRPGRSAPPRRTCFFVHTGLQAQRLECVELESPGDLLDLDWSPLVRGEPVAAGSPDHDPLFLVCTNGGRDRCCAERGRSVAAALEEAFGERAWECSHIGGDRFAANVVCFPHGVYYGRVHHGEAAGLASEYRHGRLDLEHYRGRTCYDFATQAAEAFIRRARSLDGIDDVVLVDRTRSPGRLEARFDTPVGPAVVTIAIGRGLPRRLTCQSATAVGPPEYELLGIAGPGTPAVSAGGTLG